MYLIRQLGHPVCQFTAIMTAHVDMADVCKDW